MRYGWRVQRKAARDGEVWQLDLRQAPAEVEYALQLVYDAGYRAPDGIEHIRDGTFDPIYNIGHRVLDRIEAVADAGLHSIHHIHDRALYTVPNGSDHALYGIKSKR